MVDVAVGVFSGYVEACVSDGWVVQGSPWGESVNDRSVYVLKDLPEFNGFLKVLLVDRDFVFSKMGLVNGRRVEVPVTRADVHVNAWFVERLCDGLKREQSLSVSVSDLGVYDLSFWVRKIGFCRFCGQTVNSGLNLVGFSDAACDGCVVDARNVVEVDGWCV